MIPEPEFFHVSIKLVLTNAEGRFLLLLNPPENGGKYDLPGGRINSNEVNLPISEAIAREITEELGEIRYELNPVPTGYGMCISRRGNPTFYLVFDAKLTSGNIIMSQEHKGFSWVPELPAGEFSNDGINQAVECWRNIRNSHFANCSRNSISDKLKL